MTGIPPPSREEHPCPPDGQNYIILIMKVERDEILEELMRNYVETCIERKGREKK